MQDGGHTRQIVVGVDGSLVARSAVLWAAREARLRQCDLVITHIDPPQMDAVGLDRGRSTHSALLDDSAAAAGCEPSISIRTRLLEGSISDELIRVTETAELLVLGIDRGRERASYGALGPLEDRVAVHAHCPVVVVSGVPSSDPPKEVVVGWIDTASAWWAFNAAVATAEVRHAPLTVLRVMPTNRSDDEPSAAAGDRPLLEAISGEHPPCPPNLRIRISHQVNDDPAEALVRAADAAQLLVIGCHHSADQWSIRTGPVAEAVMRGASCPVMLVSQPVHQEGSGGRGPTAAPRS